MDRRDWWATVLEVARVRQNLTIEQQQQRPRSYLFCGFFPQVLVVHIDELSFNI